MELTEDKVVPMKDQNALVMGNGKVYKIQKVRQRKIHSCVPCHQRKVKCSRDHPVCQNCVKNNLECKYFVNDRVSRGKKNKEIDKETDFKKKQELKQYMQRAKTIVTDGDSVLPDSISASTMRPMVNQSTARPMLSPPNTNGSANSPLVKHIGVNSSVHHVTTSLISPPDYKSEGFSSQVPLMINTTISPSKDSNITDSGSSASDGISPPRLVDSTPRRPEQQQQLPVPSSILPSDFDQLAPPLLSEFPQKHPTQRLPFSDFQNINPSTSTANLTSSSFMQTSISGMTSINLTQTSPSSLINNFTPNPLNTSTLNPNHNNSSHHSNNTLNSINLCLPQILIPRPADSIPVSKLEEFFNALPSKERSYALIKRYRNSVHPVLPILDLKEFEKQHDLFWENGIDKKLEFLSILYPVLYAASKTECFEYSYDEITKFELSNEIHKYLRVARSILTALEYPSKFSLRLVQSVVLLHSTLENPPIVDLAILVRIAQSLNLHRDPATFHNISDASIVQLKRLLWWEIFYLDAMTSYKNMSSPLIRLEEFDTSFPVEFFYNQLNYSICYLNGKFRYSLILNELTHHMNGLNNVPYSAVQVLKQKILDLHISCNASVINLENYIKNNSDVLNYDELNFIKWAKSTLTTYCDRSVLILQKKIILQKNILNVNDTNNSLIYTNSYNLMVNNKRSKFSITEFGGSQKAEFDTTYSFDDLSNNLIPSSLHYLYEFLKNNNDDVYNLYNWEIRNNLPFDAILIVLMNLITDLEKNKGNNKNGFELRNDIRYYILDKTIDLIFIKFDNKKRSIIKNSFTLIRYLFQILRLKFLTNETNSSNGFVKFDPYYTDQIIPKPIHDVDMKLKRNKHPLSNSHTIFPPPASSLNSNAMTTTNCSQIAPRTARGIAGQPSNISFSEIPFNNISVSDMFFNGLTSEIGTGFSNYNSPNHSLRNSRNNSVSNLNANSSAGSGNSLFSTNGSNSQQVMNNNESIHDSYKEHELQRIKSQISRFVKDERLADDDRFNNKFYVNIEKEVKELIERFL